MARRKPKIDLSISSNGFRVDRKVLNNSEFEKQQSWIRSVLTLPNFACSATWKVLEKVTSRIGLPNECRSEDESNIWNEIFLLLDKYKFNDHQRSVEILFIFNRFIEKMEQEKEKEWLSPLY